MKSELDALIEELEAGTWRCHEARLNVQCTGCEKSTSDDVTPAKPNPPEDTWPPPSLDVERRFGQPHTKLFPFIGRKVRTPAGPGTLLQVFAERVTVLLDSKLSRCTFFQPAEIEPVSWELP
jgi:hypothetical protein